MKRAFFPTKNNHEQMVVETMLTLGKQLEEAGYEVTGSDIVQAWQAFSDSVCAGWMGLSKNPDENVGNVLSYLTVEEGGD